MNVTCFSQRDPRWRDEQLGTGPHTIGQSGCLVTAAASLLADFGVPTDPKRLNRWLRANGGYYEYEKFVFGSLAGLHAELKLHGRCRFDPAPVAELEAALSNGQGVLIEVDYTPGGDLDNHWMRLVSLQEAGGWIMDPWQAPGQEMRSLHDYLAAGWNSARGIFAYATYAKNGQRVVEFTSDAAGQGFVQETACVRE